LATLTAQDIMSGLEHLGRIASREGANLELIVVGGAAMALVYRARLATQDVDVVILPPPAASEVRRMAREVAEVHGWPEAWLNDAAKGYVVGMGERREILAAPGIRVWALSLQQMLAMKLSAWRDDLDIADARWLLEECAGQDRDVVWTALEPFLIPGDELKARYAFEDLWEAMYGDQPAVG
jgi:hypothetical protein